MLGSTGAFSCSSILSSGDGSTPSAAWLARGFLGKEGGSQSEGKLKREERTAEADLGGGSE